ncbi:MAG TPA: glycosyltransferase family 4 protein [Bryobacteraceae bacterium]|nr:glycosyltransferase family 4 protein [Bryobacteraceae bacterium]
MLAFSARNIAISDAIAEDLRRSDVDPSTIVRIYNGVELDRFADAKSQQPIFRGLLGLAGKPVISMIARICEQKRQEELIRALPLVLAKHPDAVTLIVGETDGADMAYHKRLLALIDDFGVRGSVVFHGFERRIERIHAVSDALVLCTYNEPFGRCLIEAMAAGVPVIAPNQGGPTEIVTSGVNGILYTPGDERELANCITAVLDDPALARRLSCGAKARASAFSLASHTATLMDLYDEVLYGGRIEGAGLPVCRMLRKEGTTK